MPPNMYAKLVTNYQKYLAAVLSNKGWQIRSRVLLGD